MKFVKKMMTYTAALILGSGLLSGCSSAQTGQPNVMTFDLKQITELDISYDEENITFFTGDSSDLVIKEYMTDNKSSYYAKVTKTGSTIRISEGGKPLFQPSFSRYVEVYLPADYQEQLMVTSSSGKVDFSNVHLSLSSLRIDCTSGTVQIEDAKAESIHLSSTSGTLDLGSLAGEQIRLETTSGSLHCRELSGTVTYTSTSGEATIESATGSGSYKAENSGILSVTYVDVTGDLYLYNKNDAVTLTLPADLDFYLKAATKNGSVSNAFEGNTSGGSSFSDTVGQAPTSTVTLETKNGDIILKSATYK